MPRRSLPPDPPGSRQEAEALSRQIMTDLVGLTSFVRQFESAEKLDLTPVPERSLDRLRELAELVGVAKELVGKSTTDASDSRRALNSLDAGPPHRLR
jgi:hypothetical protein